MSVSRHEHTYPKKYDRTQTNKVSRYTTGTYVYTQTGKEVVMLTVLQHGFGDTEPCPGEGVASSSWVGPAVSSVLGGVLTKLGWFGSSTPTAPETAQLS